MDADASRRNARDRRGSASTTVGCGEAGGATSVEMALMWGAMLSIVLTGIQVALLFYADQIALTAAQDGLRSGRYLENRSAEHARQQAEAFLDGTAGTVLNSPAVAAELDPADGLLRVEVTGTALSFVPGLELHVERVAVGPVERVTP
jgi:hypothetical protein